VFEEASGAIAEAELKAEETRSFIKRSGASPGVNIPQKREYALYWKDFVTRYRYGTCAGGKVSGRMCIIHG